MLEFIEQYQDYSIATPKSKTTKLLEKIDTMATVYESGNNWKIGSGILATPGLIGLILGGSLGLNPLIGLAFLCGTSGAIAAWISYAFAEATEVKALPKLGLYTGDHDLLPQLTGLENTHYLALERFGIDFVEMIEAKGWLPQLLTAIKDIDLSRVPDDQHDRYHHKCMQKIREVYLLSAAHETPSPRGNRNLSESSPVDPPGETQGTIDRYLTPAAVADNIPKIRDLPQEIATLKRHVLFVASTTSGKTTALTQVISHALGSGHQVTVLDGKGNLALKNSGAVYRHCNTPERAMDAIEILEKVVATMETRQDLALRGHTDFTPISIIIDELNLIRAFLKKISKEALAAFDELIVHILLQGAAGNIFLRLAAHTSRLPKLGLDGGEADSLSFVALGRNGSYESLEDCLDNQVNGRKSKKFQDDLDGLIHESFRETLAFSTIAPMGFYRLPWVDQSPAAFAPKPELDIRSSLDRLYQSATAPEPTAIPETPKSKIDLLSDSDLESLLEKVLAYSRRKEKVKPSDITSGLRICRGYSAPEIMQLFNYLDEAGEGVVRANEFTPN